MSADAMALVERLRATKTEQRVRFGFGGMLAFSDGEETRVVPVNPDGPEAADLIERLTQSAPAGLALQSHEERAREVLREHAAFHGRPLDTVVATENAIRAMLTFAKEQREAGVREGLEQALAAADEVSRSYNEPTDWDYGAQDACIKIERKLRTSLDPQPQSTGADKGGEHG